MKTLTTHFWRDFKAFAFKGNLIDLAIAVILGGAFGSVVNSLVKNVIMPLLSYILPAPLSLAPAPAPGPPGTIAPTPVPGQGGYRFWHIGRIEIGLFLGEVLNFLIVALVLYLVMVKLLGTIERVVLPGSENEPTTKECPFCLSLIPTKARKCAHCTADLATDEKGLPQP
jgi:large conductance mechanosensitive channel